jgi:hypothetical protein
MSKSAAEMSAGAQFSLPEGPHPLAVRVSHEQRTGDRVLVVGPGRGRSLGVLAAAGLSVETAEAGDVLLDTQRGPYAAVLSTHALLHGTPAAVAARCARILERLTNGGRLYATFGSVRDPRFGTGTAVDGGWAPNEGDEAGVVHAYFDRSALEAALAGFLLLCASEHDVRETVGRWAHAPDAVLRPSVHWFVEARRP